MAANPSNRRGWQALIWGSTRGVSLTSGRTFRWHPHSLMCRVINSSDTAQAEERTENTGGYSNSNWREYALEIAVVWLGTSLVRTS